MNTENERIKALRKALNLSQEAFGEAIGLTKSSISNVEKGVRNVTEQHIKLLTTSFNINENWLRTGEGEMFIQTQTFSLDEKAKQHGLSELETDIMRGYMELPLTTRKELLELFGSIYTKHAESVATAIDPIEAELERYRLELEAEKKGQTSLVSQKQDEKLG